MSTAEHDAHRYRAAAHAMQTGVKAIAHYEPNETTPASLRVAANPAHAAVLADVAARLAANLSDRLPHMDETDVGAVLVNLGAYITHAQQLFIGYGLDPATTGQTVANVIAIAGAQLYGQTATEPTR